MINIKSKGIEPRTVLKITEVIGTISFVVGAVIAILSIYQTDGNAFLFGVVVFGSGLTTLLGVILVNSVIRIADSNDRIALELQNL